MAPPCLVLGQSLLGPVDPSFQVLSGRLKFTVRRHKFNKDSLSRVHHSDHSDLPTYHVTTHPPTHASTTTSCSFTLTCGCACNTARAVGVRARPHGLWVCVQHRTGCGCACKTAGQMSRHRVSLSVQKGSTFRFSLRAWCTQVLVQNQAPLFKGLAFRSLVSTLTQNHNYAPPMRDSPSLSNRFRAKREQLQRI